MFKTLQFLALSGLFFTSLSITSLAHAKQSFFKDVKYVANSDTDKHTLDIYGPEKRVNDAPVIIYVHGGGWQIGDKSNGAVRTSSQLYTALDMLVVSVNYRLSPDVKHPAHVQDVAKAVKWVYNNIHTYGGDKTKMILVGHSSGAQLVALLGTNTRFLEAENLPLNIFKAIIPVDSASYDLVTPPEGPRAFMIKKMRKAAFGEDPDVLNDASPILQVPTEVILSPFAIFVTAKRPEAVRQSELLAETLRNNGHQAVSTSLPDSYNHLQMNNAIFQPDNEISDFILATFGL